MVFRLRQVSRLSTDQRGLFAAYGARTTWPTGFTIYERDSSADGLFIVLRGRVVLRTQMGTGRTVVPWVATPGETFGEEGLMPDGRYATSARAEEESETLHLGGASFRAMLREAPDVALVLLQQMVAERGELMDRFSQHVSLTVEQRLVATLLRLTRPDRESEPDRRAIVPRRLLGELVGATRESISLVLGRLSAEGLIRREGNGLEVLERDQLAERLQRGLRAGSPALSDSPERSGQSARVAPGPRHQTVQGDDAEGGGP